MTRREFFGLAWRYVTGMALLALANLIEHLPSRTWSE